MVATRVRATPWFMVAVLAEVAVAVPGLQAQEVEPPGDSAEVEDRQFSVSPGVRLEFFGVASPGASLQVTWFPDRLWVSLEFLAQMTRWNVQYDPLTRRDHLYFGRLMAGVGRGEGPSAFVFYERGIGVIKTEPASWRGDTYRLTGIGLGVGYTVGRVTTSFDLSLGEANRSNPNLYGLIGISLQYRLF